ncbi:hypothetical protein [Bordetella genomosp. 11]|uniref:Uncharacterized protein n=1 Tax=Bordetella genomosp. 11 TaxID=1416808 RepID=A0A261UDF6_9BORD|nr:hypothetical protein [Bordetella genomosp. 11]OZI59956.1 hypothetical protein CAL28_10760 [Bordetella genomosp. 11]
MADEYLSEAFIKSLHAQVVSMKDDIASTAAGTRENTEAIKQISADTRGIVEMFAALEGGFKVLQGLGRLAKPLAYIIGLATAVITAYSAWKGTK